MNPDLTMDNFDKLPATERAALLSDDNKGAKSVAEGPAATPRPLTRETIAKYVRGFYIYKGGQVAEEPTKCQWNDAISTVVSDILDTDANGDFSHDFEPYRAAPEGRSAMKSEKEVNAKLAQINKSLKDTQRNFEEWDNSEDMHAIEVMRGQIAVLEWVINK